MVPQAAPWHRSPLSDRQGWARLQDPGTLQTAPQDLIPALGPWASVSTGGSGTGRRGQDRFPECGKALRGAYVGIPEAGSARPALAPAPPREELLLRDESLLGDGFYLKEVFAES